VEEETARVRIPESLVQTALSQAPRQFTLYGSEPSFRLEIGGEQVCFAGLGTPTHIVDPETGKRRKATLADVVRHIQLIDGCDHIHNSQMDVWPTISP
jgi:trimethylamine---corrinoid protein Co-methyltransferase